MPKLLTPLQYEPALDRLNDVRPLKVSDEIKQVISIPVLNSLPVDRSMTTRGNLVKCTKHGTELKHKLNRYKSLQTITRSWTDVEKTETITFSQPVYIVLINIVTYNLVTLFRWVGDDYSITLKEFFSVGLYNINFAGTKFNVYLQVQETGQLLVRFLGFY